MYALTADAAHIEEEDVFDAVLIEFDGSDGVTFFQPGVDYQQQHGAPKIIEFVGNLEHVSKLDHIFTAPRSLLLVSRKMVRVLESVGSFRYRLIPATIYSNKLKHLVLDRFTRQRTWYRVDDLSLRNDEFVILQLLDELDCLDGERTLVNGVPFSQSGEHYLGKEEAQHLELRRPEAGFPPVFCVPQLTFYCFTEEAKQACDQAGLRGLWWRPQP
ncbi:uncharacterized protein STAUR_6558 [Stigmatella aurantiaca DW4/3-1]|nr:uncharacterized protein STAUR_6558 [Stigmatella aurantiaca DW4/3-1]